MRTTRILNSGSLIQCLFSAKERIQAIQSLLASRRATLAIAKSMFIGTTPAQGAPPPPPTFLESNISKDTQQLATLSDTIARARVGLIQELVEVFNIVQVGGRPAVGGMKGAKGEWSIERLILPVPGDVRRKYRHLPLLVSCAYLASQGTPLRRSTPQ